MPFAEAQDGIRIYFETIGSGEPLLLVSGQGRDHRLWDEVVDDFSCRYRVILFDHRGTGKSGKPESPPYSTRGFAQDGVAILDYLGIQRAHAYGISMGGRICQWLGIDHRQRIGALILGATTPGNLHGARRPDSIDRVLAAGDHEKLLEALVSQPWLNAHPEFVAKMADIARDPIPAHAQRLHYQASENHEAWELLPTITAPTLVIHGSNDQVNMTANAYLLADRIPNARLHIVENGRHAYFVEFREEASRVVNEFLSQHPLPSEP